MNDALPPNISFLDLKGEMLNGVCLPTWYPHWKVVRLREIFSKLRAIQAKKKCIARKKASYDIVCPGFKDHCQHITALKTILHTREWNQLPTTIVVAKLKALGHIPRKTLYEICNRARSEVRKVKCITDETPIDATYHYFNDNQHLGE